MEGESARGGTTPMVASEAKRTSGELIDEKDEILRVDAIANTVFQICMGVAAASVAVIFASPSEPAQIGAGLVGVAVGVLALIAAPEVVFGFGCATLTSYLKKRRRRTELAIVGLFMIVYFGLAFGVAYIVGDVADHTLAGVLVGLAAVAGIGWVIKSSWTDLATGDPGLRIAALRQRSTYQSAPRASSSTHTTRHPMIFGTASRSSR